MAEVSVIVALHRLTPQAHDCIRTLRDLVDERGEVIVACDQRPSGLPNGIRIVETGAITDTSPAEKRDAALAHVTAPLCAFIDDDAYPAPNWLDQALRQFSANPDLHALGGPGVTPPNSPLPNRLSGAFYESRLGSGTLRHRFVSIPPSRVVDDWPAYNFFVRTEALKSVGGWASNYYGGEDTKLCLALREAGYLIRYDPGLIVFHHRRPVFRPLMRQTGNVGRRRGSFVRLYPATSRRAVYFGPSAVVLATPLLCVGLGTLAVRRPSQVAGSLALMWIGVAALAYRDVARVTESLVLPAVLMAGHGAYGWHFLRGVLAGSDRLP